MDSSGLQDLPVSLPLGSGFDHADAQSFQGFSHSIEHGLPAATAFVSIQSIVFIYCKLNVRLIIACSANGRPVPSAREF